MSLPTPGNARIRQFTVKGQDLKNSVSQVQVHASLFWPFKAASVIIQDQDNIMSRLKLEGNEDVNLVFDNGDSGNVLEFKFKLLQPSGGNKTHTNRIEFYTFNLISECFIKNRTMKLQESFKNISGTDMIEKMHKKVCPNGSLDKTASKGLIGQKEPYIVTNINPHEAIHQVRTRLTSDKYKTGSYVYAAQMKEDEKTLLKPLEELFSNLNPAGEFTNIMMGSKWNDAERQKWNMIGFQEGTSFSPAGRFNSSDVINSRKQAAVSTYSHAETKYNKQDPKDPSDGKTGGSLNPQDNYSGNKPRTQVSIIHDKDLEKKSTLAEKSAAEHKYVQQIKNGPSYTMQVMMDSGILCEVGKGVNSKLNPPQGGMTALSGQHQCAGEAMVINMKHQIIIGEATPRATTTLECAKGGMKA
jgi:hypothetical protein